MAYSARTDSFLVRGNAFSFPPYHLLQATNQIISTYYSTLHQLLLSSPHLQKVVGRRLDDGGGALLDDAVQRVRRDRHRQRHLLRVLALLLLALLALVMLTLLLLALVVLSRVAVGGLVGVGGVLGAAVAAAVGRLDVRPLTAEGRERGAK